MTRLNDPEALFKYALDLMCIAGTDGVFRNVNPAWIDTLGFDEAFLLEAPFMDLVHPEDRDATHLALNKLEHGLKVIDFENRVRHKQGHYIWVQWRAHISEDDHTLFYAIGRDITKAKRKALRTENDIRLLEMAENTAHVGHWHLNTQTGLLKWSNEVYNIYGRKPNTADISLDDFIGAFVGADRAVVWTQVENAIRNGTDIQTDARLLRDDNATCYVSVRAVCEKDDHDKVVGLFGIIQDITVEKQHHESLRSKEELMSMAFRATSDGIWDWDLQTDQVWFSPQWKAQLGYTDEEISNSFESWADLICDEDREKAMDELERHFRGETPRFEMVQRLRHKDGHYIFILSRAEALRNEQGQPIRLVGAHTDITEMKQLEQAKSEFTSIVSHELRTPLTAIHGALGLLSNTMSKDLPPPVKNLVEIANNNSNRLILLVNDILDMEKLQSARMDFNITSVAVEELLSLALKNHQAYASQYKVTLTLAPQVPPSSLYVLADSDRLMQVISNLLSNAIKFSNEGGTVTLTTDCKDGQVVISILDTGRGIPKSLQKKVFDKFIQADSSDQRAKGGTGLGLSIAKALIEKMDGKIALKSIEGKGSTFSVTLPEA
ncbi:PAS domain-containing protein [Terasakiella pusilla]|uniref:PAS domain-containing protein n=1 Tax=Terasakiella pusilla TaxID=64973 RepID=UPI0012EC5E09|nr:PAS domain-containing protein [Terasakiella pusilla]